MAVATLLVRLSAQIAEFQKAFTDAQRTTEQFKGTFGGVASEIAKHQERINQAVEGFSGDKTIRNAHAMAEGIKQIGGATKLTEQEMRSVNAAVTEAIAKYKALGQDAPKALTDLANATAKVPEQMSLADRAFGALSGTFGKFTAASLAATAIEKVVGAAKEFVELGVKFGPIEESYRRLTRGIGQDSEAMLKAMREGTRGLVTDLDLMQSANKAVLLGLPVTSREMGELAKTATVLGRAMGLDATQAFDDLVKALGRTSPMILDNLGLTVKVGEANEAYARKLGKSAEALTDAEKKLAFYEAALAAAKQRVDDLGESSKTLGEILTTAWASVSNVAVRAVSDLNISIGDLISNALSMKKIMSGALTSFVTDMSQFGVSGALVLRKTRMEMEAETARIAKVVDGAFVSAKGAAPDVNLSAVTQSATDYSAALATVRKELAALSPETQTQIKAGLELGKSQKEIAATTKLSEDHIRLFAESLKETARETKAATSHVDGIAKKMKDLESDIASASKAGVPMVDILKKFKGPLDNIAVDASIAGKALGKMTTEALSALKEQKFLEEVSKAMKQLAKESKATTDKILKEREEAWKRSLAVTNKDFVSSLNLELSALRQNLKLRQAAEGDSLQARLSVIQREYRDQRTLLDSRRDDHRRILDIINENEKLAAEQATREWEKHVTDVNRTLTGLQKIFKDTLAGIPAIIKSAFTGGGGLKGALDAAMSDLGSKLGEHLGNKLGQALINKFGEGSIGQKIGVQLPGILGAVFSVVPALLGKLFGPTEYEKRIKAAAEETKKLHTEVLKTHGGMDRLAIIADTVGINIREAFRWQDPAAFKKVLEDLESKTNKLNAAMAEYGFTWEDLGDKARQQKLTDLALELLDKTNLLKQAGIDYSEILRRQAGDYSNLVQAAFRTGTEIPAALRPVLQQLSEMGLLIDENGEALTDLSRLRWAETIRESTDRIVDKLDELIDKLVNGVGGALDNLGRRRWHLPVSIEVDTSGLDDFNVRVPAFAHGGIVRRPTLALIGEAGPEAVVPLSRDAGSVFKELDLLTWASGAFTHTKARVPALASGGIVRKPTVALIGEAGPEAVVPLSRENVFSMVARLETERHAGSRLESSTIQQSFGLSSVEAYQYARSLHDIVSSIQTSSLQWDVQYNDPGLMPIQPSPMNVGIQYRDPGFSVIPPAPLQWDVHYNDPGFSAIQPSVIPFDVHYNDPGFSARQPPPVQVGVHYNDPGFAAIQSSLIQFGIQYNDPGFTAIQPSPLQVGVHYNDPGFVVHTPAPLQFGIPYTAPGGSGTVHVPALQHGGIVRKATLALIGEAGPEAVVPLSRESGFSGASSPEQAGSVVFKRGAFEGAMFDSPERVDQLADAIFSRLRRDGSKRQFARRALGVE